MSHNIMLLSYYLTRYRENRYLLFLTENYAALEILQHYLNDTEMSLKRQPEQMHPFILFGSSFPRDKEYTQVCYIHSH